jgi:hypothetical protein
LVRVDSEITSAQEDDAKLVGGLNKVLIETRLQVLKTNRELITQRIHAEESGAKIAFTAHESRPNPARAEELDTELAKMDQQIKERQAESDRYSGGLIKATLDSGIATMLNTRAMLESEMLASRYGISWPAVTPAMLAATVGPHPVKAEETAGDAPSRSIVDVSVSNKQHQKIGYQDLVTFDLTWHATGLKQTARAIKGTLVFADLFGEPKFRLGAQLTDQLEPNGQRVQTGSGIDYNQFRSEHQWLATTSLSDMKVWFETSEVLYIDGSTEKLGPPD